MPLFSVVIPTYNRASLLREALESVFAQDFADYEVIVVDDGSTDETQAVLSAYGKRIRLFQQDNQGPGAARNLGIQNACGDYVAFLDSDDLWFPWTLATFSHLIHKHDFPAILSAKVKEFSDASELAGVHEAPMQYRVFSDYLSSAGYIHHVGSGTAVLKRDKLLESGGFTTLRINGEDHDLILRLGSARGFIAVLNPALLGWRRHPEGVTKTLQLSVKGSGYLVAQENRGVYAGGDLRRRQRQEIISRHVRPVSLECLQSNAIASGLRMYRATFRWHVRLGRWKYLVAFPFAAAWAALRRPFSN